MCHVNGVQVGDWMQRERETCRIACSWWTGSGWGMRVCARALERREKFHGGRVRRSRHFCIIAPGSDIQTGRRRLLRCCRFRKDSRPPSVRVLVRRISATSLAHIAVSFSFFSCSYTYGYQSRLQRGNSISRAIPIRYPWPCPVVHAICMGP